jgi:hypothetical protein
VAGGDDRPDDPALLLDAQSATKLAAELAASNDFAVKIQALQALGDTAGLHALAVEALAERGHFAGVWEASLLITEEEHTDEAFRILLEVAANPVADDRLEALRTLTDFAPEKAAHGIGDVLQTITDRDTRHEALYSLSETLGYGGEDVMAEPRRVGGVLGGTGTAPPR